MRARRSCSRIEKLARLLFTEDYGPQVWPLYYGSGLPLLFTLLRALLAEVAAQLVVVVASVDNDLVGPLAWTADPAAE
jgi:hypothetical protein